MGRCILLAIVISTLGASTVQSAPMSQAKLFDLGAPARIEPARMICGNEIIGESCRWREKLLSGSCSVPKPYKAGDAGKLCMCGFRAGTILAASSYGCKPEGTRP